MMMTADTTSAHLPVDGRGERSSSDPRRQPALTLHRGRIALAAPGAIALLTAVVTVVLAIIGIVSFVIPVLCLVVAVASVAALRVLAIRRRHAMVQRAFVHAMSPVRNHETLPRPIGAPVAPARPTSLFDAEDSSSRRMTAMELRRAALAVASGSSAVSTDIGAGERAAGVGAEVVASGSTAWVPVELPRPTYVDAAKAEREAPAPLDLPEAPRASTNIPIKASEAAARVREANDNAGLVLSSPSTRSAGPATGRINLDDVLQRRRA